MVYCATTIGRGTAVEGAEETIDACGGYWVAALTFGLAGIMSASGWISVVVTLAVFATMLIRRGAATDLLFLGGLVALAVLGVISPGEALAGFANEAVITVAALFVVAAGLRSTGVLDLVGNWLLGTARTTGAAARRSAARRRFHRRAMIVTLVKISTPRIAA